jgi:hypothetical protein
MAVTEDHNICSRFVELLRHVGLNARWAIENVGQKKTQPAELDSREHAGISAGKPVDVPGDRGHRRNPSQRCQNMLAADVSAMENVIDAAERLHHPGMDPAMRI